MSFTNAKRKAIEEKVIKTMELLEGGTGSYNTERYKNLFSSMSDAQFTKYINKLLSDEDNNFTFDVTPFDEKADLKLKNIKKAADYLKIPLDEYIYLPFVNPNGKPVRSKEPTPVGYVPTKRLEQILSKKNAYSFDITERNAKTGQVTGHDKNGRVSDMENYALMVIGAENALKEFMGARADDAVAKQDMLKDISRDGYVSQSNISNYIGNKTALNTLDVYYKSAGIMTDLVNPGYTTRRNLENKNKKERIQDKYNK